MRSRCLLLLGSGVVHRARGVESERVLVVDAAEMELEGEVRIVDDRLIVE